MSAKINFLEEFFGVGRDGVGTRDGTAAGGKGRRDLLVFSEYHSEADVFDARLSGIVPPRGLRHSKTRVQVHGLQTGSLVPIQQNINYYARNVILPSNNLDYLYVDFIYLSPNLISIEQWSKIT